MAAAKLMHPLRVSEVDTGFYFICDSFVVAVNCAQFYTQKASN